MTTTVRQRVIARSDATWRPRSARNAVLIAAAFYVSPAAAADALPVYDATQVAYGNYTIVKRVWADAWRSSFWVPGSRDVEGARRAVIEQAQRAGADAVVNLVCMNRTDNPFRGTGHYCYGDAVKTIAR